MEQKAAAKKEAEGEEKKEESKPDEENEEKFEFDEEGFLAEWDANNPPIEIPPEVKQELDNDYELEGGPNA